MQALNPVGAQDTVIHKGPRLVTFTTSAGAQWLGTTGAAGTLTGAPFAVHGVVAINIPQDGSPAILEIFAVRLGPAYDSGALLLTSLALAQAERDFAPDNIR